jgi:septal ring factor EnvC (AmiA/AmiB activator)
MIDFRWYEELKLQYEQEKTKLRENIETQAKLVEGLEKKIAQHSKEKEELDNMIKQFEKQIKSVALLLFLRILEFFF